tara:strand:- start:16168 stop:18519 length:2352 start_codon:yes stop_codon:yes gene_type:complete
MVLTDFYIKKNLYFYIIMKPSSFCSICTNLCKNETFSFLLSLSLHHENATIYIMSDSITKKHIENQTPKLKLDIKWFIELDEYSNKTRDQLDKENKWTDFQMKKSIIISKTLEIENDVLFLDTDMIITNEINDIDYSKDLGISPAYINDTDMKKVGYYNGGMIWVKNKNIPNRWIELTKESRYYDQASIDDLEKEFTNFKFGENYNYQSWRFRLSNEKVEELKKNFIINNNNIFYKGEELKSIHTHFLQHGLHKDFNQFIIDLLVKAKKYKEILCIFKILNDGNWMIHYPKQPQNGIAKHNNDSYRELIKMYKEDITITEHNSTHIWLYPTIILYDRPTLEWINNEVLSSHLLLLGNGDISLEGQMLQNKKIYTKPWIFWPRNPKLYEELLEKGGYNENRKIETLFIGNNENPVQDKYRNNMEWKDVIEEYHITKGTIHKFTAEEYLYKLRDSKYGLCLRGYGSKCHREVECMGFGTVPIITENVSINSYINSPIENIHYIYVEKPEDLKEKLKNITEEEWKIMSKNCTEWYMKNVHSTNSWKLTIDFLFYDKLFDLIRLGTNYGGWNIPINNGLNKDSIIYSGGVGEDISFDLKINDMYDSTIILIDPTTRSKTHIEDISKFYKSENINISDEYRKLIENLKPNLTNIKYISNALWDENDIEMKFYKQENKEYVSQTLIEDMFTKEYDLVKTITIDKIMKIFNHKHIDLLKLDIEGAENTVLYDMFNKKIYPKYLCIEFDLFIKKKDSKEFNNILNTIYKNNYKLLNNENYNMLFLHLPVQI